MKKSTLFAIAVLLAAMTSQASADDKADSQTPAPERAKDEAAIRDAAQGFARAFEQGDAQVIGGFFTKQAEYVDDEGQPVVGRDALKKAYAEMFAKRTQVKAEAKTDAVHFLGQDTAIEEGTFTVRAQDMPNQTNRYSTVYARENSRWLIALLKEWDDESISRRDIADLAWLIGKWETDGEGSQAQTTYEWMQNKKFIRVTYSVELDEQGKKSASTGSQVIGLDPASSVLRAWTFDSAGGIGEAHWNFSGDRWVIDSSGTLADGSRATALNFLKRTGDDAFTWRSTRRTLDGDPLPDLAPVRVKRVKSAG